MIIFPAIDILDSRCVQLVRGEFGTAEKVAADPVETAKHFEDCGVEYIHMVDLNGSKEGRPQNAGVFIEIVKNVHIPVELGGGIRNMETVDYYIKNGISRVILGSAALTDKNFVAEAVKKYGGRISVGIDAKNRKVKTGGWLVESEVDFIELAAEMEKIGVDNIIYTDIGVEGMLGGVNLEHYKELSAAVGINITASGGVRDMEDIKNLCGLGIYGAICGKSIYSGTLDLKTAVEYTYSTSLEKFFAKDKLIPAIIKDHKTGEVLMLGFMNEESLGLTIETKRAWFYSRSRGKLWNKGETSGHFQDIKSIYFDCDADALLVAVEQTGNACHTRNKSCFYRRLL